MIRTHVLRVERFATGRRVLGAVLALVVCSVVAFGAGPFQELRAWGGDARLLDMEPPTGRADVAVVLAAFGDDGRARYLEYLAFDTAFLVANALALTMLAAFALSRTTRRLPLRALAFAPLLSAGLDFAENAGIASLLVAYPGDPLRAGDWLGAVTEAKLAVVGPIFGIVAVAWVCLGWKRLTGTRSLPRPSESAL